MESATIGEDKLRSSLLKKALGYEAKETTEEFAATENDELKLIKRKVVTKQIPPDYSAVKVLLDYFNQNSSSEYEKMTDEELKKEKQKYLKQLKDLKE